jgi:amino acid transporter
MQIVLTGTIVLGLLSIVAFGLLASHGSAPKETLSATTVTSGGLGKAMIFVLLTYGGWNEIAYLSSEVRKARKNMVRVLLYGIAAITAIYLTINYVFLTSLGLEGTAGSKAVAVDVMRLALGEPGVSYISLLVIIAVLSTMNAVIITGSRANYAFGRDYGLFDFLGCWNQKANTPVNSLLFQGSIALALVLMGTGTRSGFEMMVEYTAPVFWFFFFLVGVSLFVLRWKEKNVVRPFRVPLYPFTPLLFCGVCLYMLYSSLVYTGRGGLIGVLVLLAGIPVLFLARFNGTRHSG